jgi:hypothetical protein
MVRTACLVSVQCTVSIYRRTHHVGPLPNPDSHERLERLTLFGYNRSDLTPLIRDLIRMNAPYETHCKCCQGVEGEQVVRKGGFVFALEPED